MGAQRITSQTQLYAVIGNPVAHSLSPVMHNTVFRQLGIDAVYVAFRVSDVAAAVAGVRAMGIRGVSVTIPHKMAVMELLDSVSPQASAIGAVTTIVNRDGHLYGDNSDGRGAVAALKRHTPINRRHVAIIGAGGAARAVAVAAAAEGARISILNRSRPAGEALARAVDGDYRPLGDGRIDDCDIIVNTTSVGMTPDDTHSPLAAAMLKPSMIVMDAIYNPRETRLLEEARRIGCQTIDGVDMFVAQGALQFEWWTGQPAPLALMTTTVTEALMHRQNPSAGETIP